MKNIYILMVEDEFAVASLLKINLEIEGFQVKHAVNLKSAQLEINNHLPDVVILDWALPDGEGITLLQNLRHDERYKKLGIIMLTARAEETDKLLGLKAGADDYLTKPFSHQELIARIHALLRRCSPETLNDVQVIEGLSLDPNLLQITFNDKYVTLGSSDFKLLQFMVAHSGQLFTRGQLLDRVWKNHLEIEERTIDVHIKRIREALSKIGAPNFIETIRGGGYRFDPKRDSKS